MRVRTSHIAGHVARHSPVDLYNGARMTFDDYVHKIDSLVARNGYHDHVAAWKVLRAKLEVPPANGEQQANTFICPSCSGTGEIYGPSGGLESCFGCGGSGKQQ